MRPRRWAGAARAAVFGFSLLRSHDAAAQQASVSVRRLGPPRITVEPGALTTLGFQVRNRTGEPVDVQGRLSLPVDWQLVVPDWPLTLSPADSALQLLRIALPTHAAAGTYLVRYDVSGGGRDSVVVRVPERHAVTLHLRDAPAFITAGETYELSFEVRNGGNAPALVHLAVSGSEAFPLTLDSGTVRLPTGRSQVVHARVRTDARSSRQRVNRVRLTAAVDRDTTRIEPAVGAVAVVPRHPEGASRFRRVPAQLTVRQVDRAARPVLELRGAGAVTASGATRAELLLRGLDRTASLFGEQDEYWLAVAAPSYKLRLGDRAAPYSRLGEAWRSGFGADGEVTLGDIRFGAFAQRDRRAPAADRVAEHGATIGVRPAGGMLVEGRYVSRSGANPGDVWVAHGQLSPWRAVGLDAELGRGRDSIGNGGAYAVALTGSLPRASLALRRVAADSGFPGLTRGSSSSEASATLLPVSQLSLSLTATDWSAVRTRLGFGPSGTGQRALDGRAAWGQWIDAGYRTSVESRATVAGERERRTRSARFSAAVPLGAATLRGGIEGGTSVFDDTPDEPVPFRRVDLRGNIGRGANVVAASVEWLTGMGPSSWIRDDHVRGSLNVRLPLTPSTRLSLSLSATRYDNDPARTPAVLDVALVQSLPSGHRASVRTRAMSFGAGVPPVRPTSQADYVVPFGLPTGPAEASGKVRAHVVDRETGRALPGVLLHVGDRARFTDANGRATFDALSGVTQYLEVDRTGLGADRVVVPAPVLGISVRGGETKDVELAVTRGAAVRGRLRRLDAGPAPTLGQTAALVDGGTIAGAVVQLSNGQDSLRVSVDAWGGFGFGLVAPGRWVLSVVSADLPPRYRFEQDREVLDLAPGDARDVSLRAIPSAPQVQMIAQAELTLEPAGPAARKTRRPPSDELHTPPWEPGQRRLVPPPVRATEGPRARIVPPPVEEAAPPTVRIVPPPAEEGRAPTVRIVPPPAEEARAPIVRVVPPPETTHRYTVTRWDVGLPEIARAMYGDASLWPKIWLANLDEVPDPQVLRPGLRLFIPDEAPLTQEERAAEERYRARRR